LKANVNGRRVSSKRRKSFYEKLKTHNECLEYSGAKTKDGYGWIGVNGTQITAHRLAYILEKGSIESSKILVCHKCDNPPCCNVDHLFLGTDKDNNHDMIKKGRKVILKGEGHPNSKLTNNTVEHILVSNKTAKELSIDLKVSRYTIYDIRSGKSWRHITNAR